MSHAHHSDQPTDPSVMFTQGYWDDRYRSADQIWSGNPNSQLVAQVADLSPGTALDVGSGEGADAIWLAARGWRVTGVDVSTVALERAAERAARVGAEVADRITWQAVDVLVWEPAPLQFDLVSAQFMHLPSLARQALHRRLAASVRPGGRLLIVGHHPSDMDAGIGRPHFPDLFFTAEEVAAELDPDDWQIVVAAALERQMLDAEGQSVTIRDAVLHARRRMVAHR
jgi:SAM-dependent methyltransferase